LDSNFSFGDNSMVSHKVSITLVLFFCINLISTNIYASNVGGWSMSNPVSKGASTVYTGIKNITLNGADYVKKGTAIVTPTATGVAKVLARGVAGYALSVAVEQLLGAVDWVLDPANNRITYVDPTAISPAQQSCIDLAIEMFGSTHSFVKKTKYITSGDLRGKCVVDGFGVIGEPKTTDTSVPDQTKSIPLDVVAQQVISNAQNGDTQAQVATGAAAADIVAEAETDQTGVKARPIAQQLEASSTTKPADEAAADKANEATGEQTKNPDKPDTTDLKLTFPIFCNWAPTVCDAALTVISFP
jgi:hypothetical protein